MAAQWYGRSGFAYVTNTRERPVYRTSNKEKHEQADIWKRIITSVREYYVMIWFVRKPFILAHSCTRSACQNGCRKRDRYVIHLYVYKYIYIYTCVRIYVYTVSGVKNRRWSGKVLSARDRKRFSKTATLRRTFFVRGSRGAVGKLRRTEQM